MVKRVTSQVGVSWQVVQRPFDRDAHAALAAAAPARLGWTCREPWRSSPASNIQKKLVLKQQHCRFGYASFENISARQDAMT